MLGESLGRESDRKPLDRWFLGDCMNDKLAIEYFGSEAIQTEEHRDNDEVDEIERR